MPVLPHATVPETASRNVPSARRAAFARSRIAAPVAEAFGLPVAALFRMRRGSARTAFARQCAMYLAHVSLGLSIAQAGRLFGRDRSTAAHACRVVEERRDDPRIEQLLASLETACAVPVRAHRSAA